MDVKKKICLNIVELHCLCLRNYKMEIQICNIMLKLTLMLCVTQFLLFTIGQLLCALSKQLSLVNDYSLSLSLQQQIPCVTLSMFVISLLVYFMCNLR